MGLNFNPLRPCGRRRGTDRGVNIRYGFQPSPPVRAETLTVLPLRICMTNFNPLRPCGRRPILSALNTSQADFNPLRPCGRRRPLGALCRLVLLCDFNPLRPCGRRRLGYNLGRLCGGHFNPLRPCGRRLGPEGVKGDTGDISTLSARAGGDKLPAPEVTRAERFQPSPPVRAET